MYILIEELAAVLERYTLVEKWLLAPTHRIGRQWLERVSRTGGSVVNVHVKTVRGFIMETAEPGLTAAGLRLLPPDTGEIIVSNVWTNVISADGYLGGAHLSPGLFRAVHETLESIRLAQIKPGKFAPRAFEIGLKASEMKALLDAYSSELRHCGYTDYSGALAEAEKSLKDTPRTDERILIPDDLNMTAREKNIIDKTGGNRKIVLKTTNAHNSRSHDLKWPQRPYKPAGGSVKIFHAMGESAEIIEILRRCLSDEIPFDRVEIIHTDRECYVPLIYETLTAVAPPETDPPVTFSEGLPLRFTRPGRLLTQWLDWFTSGYPQNIPADIIGEGLLKPPAGGGDDQFLLSTTLRTLAIGFGRDRYLRILEEEIESQKLRVKSGGTAAARRLENLKALRKLFEGLLDVTPGQTNGRETIAGAAALLERFGRVESEADAYALHALLEQTKNIWEVIGKSPSGDFDVIDSLRGLPGTLRVGGSGPKGGCLHVSDIMNGGYSGRPYVFVVGLDEARFPGSPYQDPLLLDSERKSLSPELQTSGQRLSAKTAALQKLIERTSGHLTMSFSSRDTIEDRDLFPSSILLPVYRTVSGNGTADQREMMNELERPAAFVSGECPFSDREWWLAYFADGASRESKEKVIGEHFPNLARGMDWTKGRSSANFVPETGYVRAAGGDIRFTGKDAFPFSSSSLETMGRCPRAFFFKYVLGIIPPEELEIDPFKWLTAAEFGELLHEVYRAFLEKIDGKPRYENHNDLLTEILENEIVKARRRIPVPGEAVFRAECRRLRKSAEIFLKDEEENCKNSEPLYLEASIGMPPAGEGTSLDDREPQELELPGGVKIRIRGRLDRIDRLEDGTGHTYVIWDYKTGGMARYKKKDPFDAGRIVQNALYAKLGVKALKKIDPEASLEYFGYFFAGDREQGERIRYKPELLSTGLEKTALLCKSISTGCFIATDNTDDCRFCDYREVCRPVAETAGGTSDILQASESANLEAFGKLRNIKREV